MQIYYCDACGLRVNNSELVPAGDKVFCQACAQKQVAQTVPASRTPGTGNLLPRRTPSGGTSLPQRPKTEGFALPTPVRGNFATRSPSPGTGSGHSHPSHSAHSSHASHPSHRATGGHERPRSGNTAALPRPTSASNRAATAKAADNATLIYAGAGAGAMLLIVVVAFAMRGGPASEAKVEATKTPPKIEVSVAKTITPPVVPIEPVRKPADMDDVRERNARREFEDAQRRVKEAGTDILAARRAMEDFVRRYRSTDAGKEGVVQLEKLTQASARPADAPSSTILGLKAEIYERPGDWDDIRNRDIASLKKVKDVTLDKVDFPARPMMEQSFGRADYLAAVITGYVEIPADGEYTFSVSSDDGSFLFIGDWRVVENDGAHAQTESAGSVPLKKGKHRLRVLYSQGMGEAALQVFWSGPNLGKQIIPPNVLSRDP